MNITCIRSQAYKRRQNEKNANEFQGGGVACLHQLGLRFILSLLKREASHRYRGIRVLHQTETLYVTYLKVLKVN